MRESIRFFVQSELDKTTGKWSGSVVFKVGDKYQQVSTDPVFATEHTAEEYITFYFKDPNSKLSKRIEAMISKAGNREVVARGPVFEIINGDRV